MEEKRLVMQFKTAAGKKFSISMDNPKADINESEIKTAMDLIVSKAIIKIDDSPVASTVEAKVVTTNETEYDLVL
ncbi:DUF2922 domain-containing protein [Peptacetobacter hominis]|uniref:DUF2922 domain-containing protein n=1 Tax=Peptacetobacter hominis TaxID=2743610 RepID=A0A544QU63_9FIRM|nr:DUF2922 domain-containing protein [Peptacetobacter hominis]TQQ84245.1 DUF2922 domain-containing protein [Peptacetobacter hominis]